MTIEEQQQNKTEVEHLEPQHHLPVEELLAGANSNQLTPVAQLFNGRSVLITGASGFIGRVLLEKLLRCYGGIRKIYILLRPKRNLQPHERLHKHLLKVPIFDRIRSMRNGQELLDKIVVISGDIGEHMLGISKGDLERLLNDQTLSIVFHSAASVKFEEPLKSSIKFNLQATKYIIQLCKEFRQLKCLCHVSTAYVNSDQRDQQEIKEYLYPMAQGPEQLLRLAEEMDEDLMQEVKTRLVGQRPNTYTYTKALAEHLIALESSQLPVAIVRPSIVVAAWKEPLPGWIDNLNGPTGLILAIGKGLLRTMRAVRKCKADIIPVDIVVNTMIAAANYAAKRHDDETQIFESNDKSADAGTIKSSLDTSLQTPESMRESVERKLPTSSLAVTKPSPPIFHCTSGDVNPITWGQMEQLFWPIILRYPSQQVLRYPFGTFKENKYHDMFMRVFVHYLPALFIDFMCIIMGKKPQLLSIYNKLHKATGALTNFSTTNYNFSSTNRLVLEQSLTDPQDKRQLFLDISSLNWVQFWTDYVLGTRRYVLKEDDSNLAEARKSFRRARLIELGFRAILLLLAVACTYPLVEAPLRQIVDNLISTT